MTTIKNDHYKALGIDKNASYDEIKKAYRVQAKKHHPDKGGDVEAFKIIKEAYEILSDAIKRYRYDNDLPEPMDTRKQALTEFAQLFSQILSTEQYNGKNPLTAMSMQVNNKIKELRNQRTLLYRERTKLIKLKRNLKYSGEHDVLGEVLRGRRQSGVKVYLSIRRALPIMEEMLLLIAEYEYTGQVATTAYRDSSAICSIYSTV